MTDSHPTAVSFGASDMGPRENNEDEFYTDDGRGIYFVIDGMGGHAAGEQAAAIAKARIRGRLERLTDTVEQRIREAITIANNEIYEAATQRPEWRGMACVLTVAVIEDGQVTVGHVGDSRLYCVLPGALKKVTRDHSPVGQMEDSRELEEADALVHPRRNEVYRDVGSQIHDIADAGFIDVYHFPFAEDTGFLLCSDGLSDTLSSAEILATINQNSRDRTAIVRALIRRAAEDGRDNVTAVFVHGPEFGAAQMRQTAAVPAIPSAVPFEEIPGDFHAPMARARWKYIATAALGIIIGAVFTLAAEYFLRVAPFVFPPASHRAHRIYVQPQAGPRPISAALEQALPGDIIEIAPGEYLDDIHLKDGITILARDVTLRSSAPVAIVADNLQRASISGLRVLPAEGSKLSVGVSVRAGNVELHLLDISGATMAGVEFSYEAGGIVESCKIHNNTGPGILIRDEAGAFIDKNEITGNGRLGARGPGIQVTSASPVRITGNIFTENGAEAIWLPATSSTDILNENNFGPEKARGKARDIRVVAPASSVP